MKLLITGARGTLGRALTRSAQQAGHAVVAWSRERADPLDPEAVRRHLEQVAPAALMHLAIAATPTGRENEAWRINVEWPAQLASVCAERGIAMLFTSTALVFDDSVSGPFTLATPANARQGYGFEKRCAEHLVLLRHPAGARVVRLGWQIDRNDEGNNMVAHAQREMARRGYIDASASWYPACSFLDDTAAALLQIVEMPPGLYMADSNRDATYAQILAALAAHYGLAWNIRPNHDYVYDQRLIDARLRLPDLRQRLPELPS